MGIQGLLKSLKDITSDRSLSELNGLRVAVDGYVWLHKGVFFSASDLGRGVENRAYVSYFVKRVQQLLRYATHYPTYLVDRI